jgi:hypothetical protein
MAAVDLFTPSDPAFVAHPYDADAELRVRVEGPVRRAAARVASSAGPAPARRCT